MKQPSRIRLTVNDGTLYFPKGGFGDEGQASVLVRFYPAGDCDSCPWPMECGWGTPDGLREKALSALRMRLAYALYDERKTNEFFPPDAQIELPDGSLFDFDSILATKEA